MRRPAARHGGRDAPADPSGFVPDLAPDGARGVTTALNYVLVLGVVSLLVATLVAGFGGLVENQQERAVREQLTVLGNRVAAEVETADRLVGAAAPGNAVAVRVDLPTRAVGARYTVGVDHAGGDRYRLVLATESPDVRVTVPFRSSTTVAERTVHGGPLRVVYDPGSDTVVVERA